MSCKTLNLGSCNKCCCGTEKSNGEYLTKLAGDWVCSSCRKNNFAKRRLCFSCSKGRYNEAVEKKMTPEEHEQMKTETLKYYKEIEERVKREEEKKKEEEAWRWAKHEQFPDAQEF